MWRNLVRPAGVRKPRTERRRRPAGPSADAARGPYRRIGAGRLPARRRLDRRGEGVPGGAELDRRSARRVKDGPDDTGPVVGWCPWSRMVPVKAESREPCRSGYRPNRLAGSPSGCGTYSASASPGARRRGRCGNRRSRRLGGVGVAAWNAPVAAQSVSRAWNKLVTDLVHRPNVRSAEESDPHWRKTCNRPGGRKCKRCGTSAGGAGRNWGGTL